MANVKATAVLKCLKAMLWNNFCYFATNINVQAVKKHYLVTGGAGFIGSALVKELLKNEELKITCLDNFDPFYDRKLKLLNIEGFEKHPNFNLFDLDIEKTSPKVLQDTLTQPVDVIIHLAAKAGVRPSISNPISYQQTNIIGTQNLLDFAQQTGVKQFVFASSSSVYGVNENIPWKEDAYLLPISPYAMSKQAGEMAGHVYSYLYGIRFVALRLFTVYGPGQRPDLAIHRFVKALLQNEPITMYGDGSSSRDYTYIEDIVQGILGAIQYTASPFEIINLGNNYSITLKELITTIEEVTGKKAVIHQLPEQPGDLQVTRADISKAQRLLQYQPSTQLRQGLENFYQWFKEHEAIALIHK